jgi:drug/metabolite transporter (DMT)-like permease
MMMLPSVRKSKLYTLLFVGVLCVSTGSIFARIAEAPPLAISAYRAGLAGILLLPFAFALSLEEFKKLKLSDWCLGASAGGFLTLHFYTWISSFELTTVAASVVLVTTNPVWVGIISFLAGERTNSLTVMSIVLSFAGALMGDLLALVGALCMTGYIMAGKLLRGKISLLPYIT